MGHIHMAWPDFNFENGRNLIAACDAFLALPMLLLEPENDRRRLYGKASCVRLKSYTAELDGIEYRTLSSYFASSDELIDYVWNNLQKAIDFTESGKIIENWEEISNIINTANLKEAKKQMQKLSINI